MPITKSAAKRLRQSERLRARNRSVKSELRTLMRKVREAAAEKRIEEADALFRQAAKRLDQAAGKGIIHKNAAARCKSRLSSHVKNAKGKGGPAVAATP
ncbi:MAG: 30S ribosomal protein S20 [Planctomycetia bacterium]|nr:30S ribosomal protein S20 [Planctomycetia bacterium]